MYSCLDLTGHSHFDIFLKTLVAPKIYLSVLLEPLVVGGGAGLDDGLLGLPGLHGLALLPPTI